MVKKETKKRILIGAIIFVVLVAIAFISGSLPFALFLGGNKIACSSGGIDTYDCRVDGGDHVAGDGNIIELRIDKPSNVDSIFNMACDKAEALTGKVCPAGTGTHSSGVKGEFILRELGKQVIIVRGVTEEGKAFETYGICRDITSRRCWIYDVPAGELTANEITIHFRAGGYEESDACDVFDVCIPRVIEPETEEVIEEFPPEETIDEAIPEEPMEEVLLVDEEVEVIEEIEEVTVVPSPPPTEMEEVSPPPEVEEESGFVNFFKELWQSILNIFR